MAERIANQDLRSGSAGYGGGAVAFGLPFVAVGGYFALAGFGVLFLPGRANAPLFVIGLVGVVFALAGLLVVCRGLAGMAARSRARELARMGRDEPWLLDHRWDPRGIRDHPVRRAAGALFGAGFLALFLVPFHWWAFFSGQGPWMVKAITGLFDLIVLCALFAALRRIARAVRFGVSRLRFVSFPFHPGGKLKVVFSPNRFDALDVRLRFVEERDERVATARGNGRRRVACELAGESKRFEVSPVQAEVDIEFDLPENPAWTTSLGSLPVRYWELVIEAKRPGLDFRTAFPLPVYPEPARSTIASSPAP